MILDVTQMVQAVPQEQIVKAFTLDANNFDVAYRVVFRQIMPQVINSLRLNLKPMMLFLFAGEMIAASDGLAYRIAIMRRHMGMDVILPYVLWVALLLYLIDLSLRVLTGGCIHGFRREHAEVASPTASLLRSAIARRGQDRACAAATICIQKVSVSYALGDEKVRAAPCSKTSRSTSRRASSSCCSAKPAAARARCCG